MKSAFASFALLLLPLAPLAGCFSEPTTGPLAKPTAAAVALLNSASKTLPTTSASVTTPAPATATAIVTVLPTPAPSSTGALAAPELQPTTSLQPKLTTATPTTAGPANPTKNASNKGFEKPATGGTKQPPTKSADVTNAPSAIDGSTLKEMDLLQTATTMPKGPAKSAQKQSASTPSASAPKQKSRVATAERALRSLWVSTRTGALICPPSAATWCEAALRATNSTFVRTAKRSIVCQRKDAAICRAAYERASGR